MIDRRPDYVSDGIPLFEGQIEERHVVTGVPQGGGHVSEVEGVRIRALEGVLNEKDPHGFPFRPWR